MKSTCLFQWVQHEPPGRGRVPVPLRVVALLRDVVSPTFMATKSAVTAGSFVLGPFLPPMVPTSEESNGSEIAACTLQSLIKCLVVLSTSSVADPQRLIPNSNPVAPETASPLLGSRCASAGSESKGAVRPNGTEKSFEISVLPLIALAFQCIPSSISD